MAQDAVKDFLRALDRLDHSKGRREIFTDFCEMFYCALAKPASPFADQRDQLEAQYMRIVARYRNKDHVRAMPSMVEILRPVIEAGGRDVLGEIAAEVGALNPHIGQFFTPYTVSRAIAEMTLPDAESLLAGRGFFTLCEPACGSGGMVIAAADTLDGRNVALSDCWVEATELAPSVYHMAYIQIALRGVSGKVICGNSLSGEIQTFAYTPAASDFVLRHGHPFADQIAARIAANDAARKKADLIAQLERDHLRAAE